MQLGFKADGNQTIEMQDHVSVDISALSVDDVTIEANVLHSSNEATPHATPKLVAAEGAADLPDGSMLDDLDLGSENNNSNGSRMIVRSTSMPDVTTQEGAMGAAGEGDYVLRSPSPSPDDTRKLTTSSVIRIVRELSNHLADLGPSHSAATLEREASSHELEQANDLWRGLYSGNMPKVPMSTNALVTITALATYLTQLEDSIIPNSMLAAFLSVSNSTNMPEDLQVNTLSGLLMVLPRPCIHVLQILMPQLWSWIKCFEEKQISLITIWQCFLPVFFGSAFSEDGWVLQTGCITKLIEHHPNLGLLPPDGAGNVLPSPRTPDRCPASDAKFKSMPRVHQTDPDDVKRKKYKVKKGVSVVNGTPSYEVMVNLKLGIKIATTTCHEARRNTIELKDFQVKNTETFPACGTVSTPSHDSRDFLFKDYCPNVFRQIREQYSIPVADYLGSICDAAPLRELGSPGKSGAVFYFSHDMKYLIKSVSKKESQFLRRILPYYYEHVMKHQNTQITLFYGLYSVKPHGMPNIRLVVMSNMFDMVVHEVYDIKGSTHGRITQDVNKKVEGVVLKDLDLGFKVHTPQDVNAVILDQLQIDVQFLESMSIMDYSLLLGVHYLPADQYELDDNGYPTSIKVSRASVMRTPAGLERQLNAFQQDYGGTIAIKSTGEVVILCFGVIDILQTYDGFKTTEHWCKRICINKEAISVNDPVFYASRFKERMNQLFVHLPQPPQTMERGDTYHPDGGDTVRIGPPDPLNPSRIKVQLAAEGDKVASRSGPPSPEYVHEAPSSTKPRVSFDEESPEQWSPQANSDHSSPTHSPTNRLTITL